jgi:hypothetical protein
MIVLEEPPPPEVVAEIVTAPLEPVTIVTLLPAMRYGDPFESLVREPLIP